MSIADRVTRWRAARRQPAGMARGAASARRFLRIHRLFGGTGGLTPRRAPYAAQVPLVDADAAEPHHWCLDKGYDEDDARAVVEEDVGLRALRVLRG